MVLRKLRKSLQGKFKESLRRRDVQAQVRRKERGAFEKEQLAQAGRVGQERAKILAEQQIKQVRTGKVQKKGVLAGFDKFLAGTGVAKGTAPVLRKGSQVKQPSFDVLGGGGVFGSGGARKRKGGFNVI